VRRNSRTPAPIWVHEPIITPELKSGAPCWSRLTRMRNQRLPRDRWRGIFRVHQSAPLFAAAVPMRQRISKLVCDFATCLRTVSFAWARSGYPAEQGSKDVGATAVLPLFAAGHLQEPAERSKDPAIHKLRLTERSLTNGKNKRRTNGHAGPRTRTNGMLPASSIGAGFLRMEIMLRLTTRPKPPLQMSPFSRCGGHAPRCAR